jgi:hypothetical protein
MDLRTLEELFDRYKDHVEYHQTAFFAFSDSDSSSRSLDSYMRERGRKRTFDR